MKEIKLHETCPSCKKEYLQIIQRQNAKMDDRRNTYYTCPYCDAVCGTILLAGNEEVETRAIPEYTEKY